LKNCQKHQKSSLRVRVVNVRSSHHNPSLILTPCQLFFPVGRPPKFKRASEKWTFQYNSFFTKTIFKEQCLEKRPTLIFCLIHIFLPVTYWDNTHLFGLIWTSSNKIADFIWTRSQARGERSETERLIKFK
jgi:hypothetical protein